MSETKHKYLDKEGLQHLLTKMDKREVNGKGLSTNDFTDKEQEHLRVTHTEGVQRICRKDISIFSNDYAIYINRLRIKIPGKSQDPMVLDLSKYFIDGKPIIELIDYLIDGNSPYKNDRPAYAFIEGNKLIINNGSTAFIQVKDLYKNFPEPKSTVYWYWEPLQNGGRNLKIAPVEVVITGPKVKEIEIPPYNDLTKSLVHHNWILQYWGPKGNRKCKPRPKGWRTRNLSLCSSVQRHQIRTYWRARKRHNSLNHEWVYFISGYSQPVPQEIK
ncbi:MAG: hypothetical protein NC217_07680 [Muribaculaceae bacterium]|nr:hypothetical protein [Muribaculaceae bacterium]